MTYLCKPNFKQLIILMGMILKFILHNEHICFFQYNGEMKQQQCVL